MGVDVDEAGGDDLARGVELAGPERVADLDDAAVGDGDVRADPVIDGRFGASLKPNRHGGTEPGHGPECRGRPRVAAALVSPAHESARYHSRTPDGLTP